MPTQGLSLVGFMNQTQALDHLRTTCIPADPSDAALIPIWQAAQNNLGAAIPNAGHPQIIDIPPADQHHIQTMMQQPWFATSMQGALPNLEFKMVEIDPLLAYQFTVDIDRSDHHCGAIGNPPTVAELLHVCLPISPPPEQFQVSHHHQQLDLQSVIIKSRSGNLRITAQGIFSDQQGVPVAAGFQFGFGLHLVHVVRLNGQCFLHNGYHRAVGARMRGATHIPCVVRDVPSLDAVGVRPGGATFQQQDFARPDPPTVGHFAQGRAQAVHLRVMTHIMHVTWARHTVPDE